MATTETPQEALQRIQSMGFGKNDALVIMGFSERGIPAEQIDPRHNVLTFNAWKAKGRVVAKGAISVRAITWIPCKDKDKDTKSLRPKNVFLFHESQTNPKDAPKGTAPAAANNPALIREGTYETKTLIREGCAPSIKETPEPYREDSYELNVDAFKDEDNSPQACNCPAVGIVTNVNCLIHGKAVAV